MLACLFLQMNACVPLLNFISTEDFHANLIAFFLFNV